MMIMVQYNDLYFLTIGIFFLSIVVQVLLSSKMKKYSKQQLSSSKTGAEIAQEMLANSGIYDVKVISVDGFLTDHYNPLNKTINLSPNIYNGRSVAAAAVAAHECGHAVQHNKNYIFMYLRSALVPVCNFCSTFIMFFLLIGFMMINTSLLPLEIAICLYAVTTLFTIITLPVELDASNRALNWIDENNIVSGEEYDNAKSALRLAAMTYVLAALASLTELLRLVSIVNDRKE